MQTCRFMRGYLYCLTAGLGLWMAVGAEAAAIAGETVDVVWTPASLASTTNLPLGQTITVTGTVARIERDGISSTTFFLVLKDEIYCRMIWPDLALARRNLRLSTEVGGRVVAYWNKRIMFVPGEKVAMRGICKKELSRVTLDQAQQTEQFNAASPGLLWGR